MSDNSTLSLLNQEANSAFAPQAKLVLGCQFASLVIDNFLAGVLFVQVITYFAWQTSDPLLTKLVVIWTSAMSMVVTIYYWVYIQYLLVQNFGDWAPWLQTHWLSVMPFFDSLTISAIQGFFAYRAYLLLGYRWYYWPVIGTLILLELSCAIGVMILFNKAGIEPQAVNTGPALCPWLIATSVTDIIISIAIFVGLKKSRTGWEHTDKTVVRLVKLTVECQLLPTCFALAYLAEWFVQPSSMLGAVFQSIASKAYAVGLLYSLNSRISFTARRQPTMRSRHPQLFSMSHRDPPTEIQVEVETETYIHTGIRSLNNKNGDFEFEAGKGASHTTIQARLTHPELLV